MKIAIASEGKDENSLVSPVGGRAEYYLIFEDRELVKTIRNPFRIGGGGAGPSVAQMLANENVNLVVSGNFGGNMQAALDSKDIKIKTEENKTVKKIIDEITEKK